MSFGMLYAILLLIVFGGFFAIKYSIKGLEKVGVFDDDFETRYTPPTQNTYVGFAVIMGLFSLLMLCIII